MRRTALIVLAAVGGLCVLALIVAAIAVATVDPRALIGPLQARVKAATGRDLVIAGPVDLRLSLQPKVVLNDVTLGNAAWGTSSDLLRARQLSVQFALLPLLERRYELVELALTEPAISLETDAKGRGNWVFDVPNATAAAPATPPAAVAAGALGVGTFSIDNGAIAYRDGASGKTTRISIDRLLVDARRGTAEVVAEFRGKVSDVPLEFTASVGSLEALLAGRGPYPLSAKGQVAGKPASLTTTLTTGKDTIALDDMTVALGGFSAKGRIAVHTGEARTRYSFALDVSSVALDELPLPVAAPVASPAVGARKGGDTRYLFSEKRLPIEALRSFDAEGELSIAELRIGERTKLAPLQTRVALRDGKLDAPKLTAGVFGGTIDASFTLDASTTGAGKLALKADGRSLDLGAILAAAGSPRQIRGGQTTLALDISASGDSPHAWASTATGNARVVVGPTTLVNTRLDLDNALDKLAQAVNPFRELDASTELQCAVVRLPLSGGVARVDRSIALETKKIGATASGTLDFRNETLDLSIRPRIRQGVQLDIPRFAELVRFTGPFREPRVAIDAVASAETIAKIGAAIGTGGLSVLGNDTAAQRERIGECVRGGAGAGHFSPGARRTGRETGACVGGRDSKRTGQGARPSAGPLIRRRRRLQQALLHRLRLARRRVAGRLCDIGRVAPGERNDQRRIVVAHGVDAASTRGCHVIARGERARAGRRRRRSPNRASARSAPAR